MSKTNQKNQTQEEFGNLSLRRRQEAIEQKEKNKKHRIYRITAIVVAILVAALLVWDSGVVQRRMPAYTVDGVSYTTADVNYYFYNAYNGISAYASYMGLDTSKDLKDQEYADGMTWYDYFLSTAEDGLKKATILTKAAKAEGYTISEEGQTSIDSALQSIKTASEQYNISESTYLTYVYGKYMTKSAFIEAVTREALATDYEAHLKESYEVTNEELDTYYADNAGTLDNFDFKAYYVSIGLTPEYNEDGTAKDFDADALANAEVTLEENAAKLKEALESGSDAKVDLAVSDTGASDFSSVPTSSLSYYAFNEWVTSSDRKAGDIDLVADTRTNSEGEEYVYGYYAMEFLGRSRDDYHGINFLNALVQAEAITDDTQTDDTASTADTQYDWDAAEKKANELMDQWKADGATEDGFKAMAEENSASSTVSYTNVAKDAQNAEVDAWLFGSEHKAGDTIVLRDEALHGYRLIYVTGYDDMFYWQTVADTALRNEKYDTWMTEQSDAVGDGTTESMIKYVG